MSNNHKRRPEKQVTKKFLKEKNEELMGLMVAMERALTEWEIWFQLLPSQHEHMDIEEFVHIVKDGPIFDELSSKIMDSIRAHLPVDLTPPTDEEMQIQDRPALFDADGNIVENTNVDKGNKNNAEEKEKTE